MSLTPLQKVCIAVKEARQGQQVGDCAREEFTVAHPNLQGSQIATGYRVFSGARGYMLVGPGPDNRIIAGPPFNIRSTIQDPQTQAVVYQATPNVTEGLLSIANPLAQAGATILQARAGLNQPAAPAYIPPPVQKSNTGLILAAIGGVSLIVIILLMSGGGKEGD